MIGKLAGLHALVLLFFVLKDSIIVRGAHPQATTALQTQVARGRERARSPYKEIDFNVEETLEEDYYVTMKAFLSRYERDQTRQMHRKEALGLTSLDSGLLESLAEAYRESNCVLAETNRTVARDYLVVLPAGDSFDASRWMSNPRLSNWDIMVIYYGKQDNFSCPLCRAVYRASGAKWRLVWGFTLLPEWEQYQQQYKAVMFADDDLIMDLCTINTVFSTIRAYKLLMAQPSICPVEGSHTPWDILYQQNMFVLRYTTMIEIMAPTFEMDYFQNFVRPSLYNAYVGWGLDFVWPFLLNYPRDKIAVIDHVCVRHPPSKPNKANSVYDAAGAPYRKKEEETRRFAEYGYFESAIVKKGWYHMAVEVVGVVPKPVTSRTLLGTSHGAFSVQVGAEHPIVLLLQSSAVLLACLLLLRTRIRAAIKQML